MQKRKVVGTMKKSEKIISLLIIALMAVQMLTVSVFAQSLEAYWGPDFPDEDYCFGTGEAVFWQKSDITNFEFKLFKNNQEVYSKRVEEGLWEDGIDGEWYNEYLFLPQFSENGSGSYHFTVSSLTNDKGYIDDEEIIETAKSGTFSYTKPSDAVSIPKIVSNKDGIVDWEKTDDNTGGYMYDLEIDYGTEVYDPDYVETYCFDEEEWSAYDVANLMDFLEYMDENYDGRFPISNAKVKIRVRAMPYDITEYNPSPYTDWYTIDCDFSEGGTDEEKPLDRTVVSESYYKAAKVCYDLGLISDIYESYNKNVTRGELAEIFTKMLGMEEIAETLKDRERFSDVESGTVLCGYVNAMCNQGIMAAMSGSTFEPETEEKYENICKMIVSVLGYAPYAQERGGYPQGYISTAASTGMTKGVIVSVGSSITKEQMAQIVYNSLSIGIMEQTGWGSNAIYEVTKDTLLYRLGLSKFNGDVTFAEDNKAALSGFIYNDDNLEGVKYSENEAVIVDNDIKDYEKTSMELYLNGKEILCGFEYTGVVIIGNNGETETTSRIIPIEIYSYGDVYTTYRIGTTGAYKPIPAGAVSCLIGENHGNHNITVYAANDDESIVTSKRITISHNNMHTATFVVNGQVYEKKEIGCGKKISAPSVNLSGYTLRNWENMPSVMPDKDIVIYGVAIPNVTYTGTVVSGGNPAYASLYVRSSYVSYTNGSTGEFSFTVPQGETSLRITLNGLSKTLNLNGSESRVDLGTIDFDKLSTTVETSCNTVVSADFEEAVLTEEDIAYKAIEGNDLLVTMKIDDMSYYPNYAITSVLSDKYPQYTACNHYNITLTKAKSGTEAGRVEISETDEVVSVKFALAAQNMGKSAYGVLREHMGQVDMLTTVPNENGEYIEVSDDIITVYAKKFSAYTIVALDNTRYKATLSWTPINLLTVNVTTVRNPVESSVLYVVYYDSTGKIAGITSEPDFSSTNKFEVPDGVSSIRAFIWDGVTPLMQQASTSLQ